MRDRRITWGLKMLRPHGGGRLDGVAYLGQAEMLAWREAQKKMAKGLAEPIPVGAS